MKVALVHDWLNVKVGGAEQVFFELANHYPEADLYALTYNKKLFKPFLGNRKVRASFLQYMPGFIKRRPYLMLPFVKWAVTSLKFEGYDLVISNSSAWVKNVNVPDGTRHVSYCHSPARMLWDSWPKYLDSQNIGPFKLGPISRFVVTILASRLRTWDYYASQKVDVLMANSEYIASRIKKYYGRSSVVLYPPVKLLSRPGGARRSDYYLILSVLSDYKNIELAIKAFASNSRRLIIAGSGPDEPRLRLLAGGYGNIEFVGRVSDAEKLKLLSEARALVFPSIEDFGITPVEAMSVGTPVVALKGGGLVETVGGAKAGVFFDQAVPASLNRAIEELESKTWDHTSISGGVDKYSISKFGLRLDKIVQEAL